MIQDLDETLNSWQHSAFSYALLGTLAAGDYLGDTTNGTGLSMPDTNLETVHYNAATASGTGTSIDIHNVTQGTSASFTPSSGAGSTTVDLDFNAGDELAIAVGATDATTAGADVQLALEYDQYRISSTTHGR